MTTESSGKGGRRAVRIGKYEVLHHIASGGMGAVYKAVDVETQRAVALKVLPPDMAANPKMCERFKREANAVAKLRHENIVALYEFGEQSSTYYLALEFVDGIDLHEYLQRHGTVPPELARELLKQAAKALAHAHSQNLVHRDIKPSNFLLTEKDGRPLLKLTDLGLARDAGEEESRLTRDGSTIGTVDYMSPEQAQDSGQADIRSDIYSLGCTFFHLLAGHAPFHEGSLIEKLTKHVNVEPPDIRTLNADVPDDLYWILERSLRKRPEDRYQTPLELLRDLLNPQQIVPPMPRLVPLDKPSIENRQRHAADNLGSGSDDKTSTAGRKPKPPRQHAVASTLRAPSVDATSPEDRALPRRRRPRTNNSSARQPNTLRKYSKGAAALVFIGGGLLLVLIAAGALAAWRLNQTAPPEESNDVINSADPNHIEKKQPANRTGRSAQSKSEVEVPRLYPKDVQFDPAQLREVFEGPLNEPLTPESEANVLTVSRLGGGHAGHFATLPEAVAAAPEGKRTAIVVADNGPLFVSALPPVANRTLVIGAAKGFRPLVVWEAGGDQASALLKVSNGNLALDGLDFVVKWTDPRGDEPAAFAEVIGGMNGGDFLASHCTFSAAGKHPRGLIAVRLDSPYKQFGRLTSCYVRGPDLTALSFRGAGGDVQFDNCLLVGNSAALVDLAWTEETPITVRVLRSTLVAGKHCFLLHTPEAKKIRPLLQLRLLDSLFAHSDAGSEGNLLMATGPVSASAMSRVVNCVYTGWHKLLAAGDQAILGTDLTSWRRLWADFDGDRALADVWPAAAPVEPEETPAAVYHTRAGPAFLAAVSTKGLLGSPLQYRERPMWLGLTYERFVYPALPLPTATQPPEAKVINIVLTKNLDLAQVLATARPGQKLVVRVAGSGEVETRPIVLKGVDVTLCFEPPKDPKAPPLTLVPDRQATADQETLFDVEGGSLELINVRIVFENRNAVMPRRLLRIKDADLRLLGCWLQGPLDNGPATFRTLIEFAGSGKDQAESALSLAALRTVLMAGPKVLELHGTGARVRMQQCLVLAAQDGFECQLGATVPPRLNVQWLLERNTFAVRRNWLVIGEAPEIARLLEPMVVQAEANLFVDPFAESPRTSCLLAIHPTALHRGLMLWQGIGNAYDAKRWHTFVTLGEWPLKTTHASWQQLWGKAGERDAVIVSWPATPSSTFAVGEPQLDRLRPPGGKGAAYGADISKFAR